MKYYMDSAEECLNFFKSSSFGLSKDQVKTNRETYGLNKLDEEKEKSKLRIFLSNFKSSLIYLLLFAAIFSFFIGKSLDAFVILGVVFLNAVIGFYLEGKAKKALEDLKKLSTEMVLVIREGKEVKISSHDLVPGDIVLFSEGDKVPADIRLFEACSLFIDESTFTGESLPKEKNHRILAKEKEIFERDNMIYMGTTVTAGHGKGIVVEIGSKTELGKISNLYKSELHKKTPLQERLDHLTKLIGVLVLLVTIIIFFLGIYTGKETSEMVQISISMAVSAIPEGLPVAIAVILAMGVYTMSKKKTVVRKMTAVEALGRVNIICSDKTGTLTYNQLRASTVILKDEVVVDGEGYEPEGRFIFKNKKDEERIPMFLEAAVLCNDSELTKHGNKWIVKGDPLEAALLSLAKKYGLDEETTRKENPRLSEISFSSEHKFMASLNAVGDMKMLYAKGAPEVILEKCSYFYEKSGARIPLKQKDKEAYLREVSEMSKDGLKVLALAFKDFRGKENKIKNGDLENLVFLGLVGFIDSYRSEAVEAIKKAKEAGIKVVMITGDHIETASKIAKDLGILGLNDKAILAKDLDKIHGSEVFSETAAVTVYARVAPEHKYKIVNRLKEMGNIVAMTGDGVNDVPGLSKADIGIAMGMGGTAAARDAADLVLMDDNFATIVVAIDEGRTIFSNIRKVLFYLFSTNLGEVLTIITALILVLPLPLTAIQILWINLVTDGFFTVPLGLTKAEDDNLKRPPRKSTEGLLSTKLKVRTFGVALIIALGTIFVFMTSLDKGITYAQTMAFTTLVVFQWFNAFNARSEGRSLFRKLGKDKILFYALGGAVVMQLLVIYTPFFNTIFHTIPLALNDWGKILLIASSVVLLVEGEKLFLRDKKGLLEKKTLVTKT